MSIDNIAAANDLVTRYGAKLAAKTGMRTPTTLKGLEDLLNKASEKLDNQGNPTAGGYCFDAAAHIGGAATNSFSLDMAASHIRAALKRM